MNANTPCRQHLHRETFEELCSSRRAMKLVAYETASPVGLAICVPPIEDDPLLPWINTEYFKANWGQYWGRMIYVPALCVGGEQASGTGRLLLSEIQAFMQEAGYLAVGFDHSIGSLPGLPEMISHVGGGTRRLGSFPDGAIDHQAYHLMLDVRNPHLDDSLRSEGLTASNRGGVHDET